VLSHRVIVAFLVATSTSKSFVYVPRYVPSPTRGLARAKSTVPKPSPPCAFARAHNRGGRRRSRQVQGHPPPDASRAAPRRGKPPYITEYECSRSAVHVQSAHTKPSMRHATKCYWPSANLGRDQCFCPSQPEHSSGEGLTIVSTERFLSPLCLFSGSIRT
jgi:hypothetical protein